MPIAKTRAEIVHTGDGEPWHLQEWGDDLSMAVWVRVLRFLRERGIWSEWVDLDHKKRKMPKRFGNKQIVIAYSTINRVVLFRDDNPDRRDIAAMGEWLIETFASDDQMAEQMEVWAEDYRV